MHAEAVEGATREGRTVVLRLKGCGHLWNKSVRVSFFLPLLFKCQLTDGAEERRHRGSSHPVWPWGFCSSHKDGRDALVFSS